MTNVEMPEIFILFVIIGIATAMLAITWVGIKFVTLCIDNKYFKEDIKNLQKDRDKLQDEIRDLQYKSKG